MNYKKVSKFQEDRVAKKLGGKSQIASGALYFAKADVRTDKFLCECKTTERSSYSLKLATWNKVYLEALKDSMRISIMQIDLEGGMTSLIVMRFDDFQSCFCDLSIGEVGESICTSKKSILVTSEVIVECENNNLRCSIGDLELVVLHFSDFIYMCEEVMK